MFLVFYKRVHRNNTVMIVGRRALLFAKNPLGAFSELTAGNDFGDNLVVVVVFTVFLRRCLVHPVPPIRCRQTKESSFASL